MSTWFITGCSTGLGRHLAQAVLQRGHQAVITARDPVAIRDLTETYPSAALALALDVTDPSQVTACVQQAEARFRTVDVLVNNAGYGYRAAVEEADQADIDELFATNVFGPVALIKAVLPGMRARRRGTIVNISSIAALHAAAGSGYYSATKRALEGISEALRREAGPLGITVMAVEPGAFRTDFASRSLRQSRIAIADYADTAGRRRKENEINQAPQQGDPARAAQIMIDAVESPNPPFRLLLGSDAVRIAYASLDAQRAELQAGEAAAMSTDFPACA